MSLFSNLKLIQSAKENSKEKSQAKRPSVVLSSFIRFDAPLTLTQQINVARFSSNQLGLIREKTEVNCDHQL